VNYFLLVYDRATGKLREERSFSQRAEALQARFAVEKLHRAGGEDLEVVVVGAQSRSDLLRTHARYFLTLDELARRNEHQRPADPAAEVSDLPSPGDLKK
jgi:dephospho-CoA kinase